MIIVISDDFTGAAELAGIALRYGIVLPLLVNQHSIELLYEIDCKQGFIVNTDSRSRAKNIAHLVNIYVFENVVDFKPVLLYKKIDSVLRGYVLNELKIQMEKLGLQKAIIAPANPSLGRTIEHGKYYINKQEIAATDFVNDPEFPAKSSLVKEMLNDDVEVLLHSDTLPEKGIVVAATTTNADVKAWANKIDNSFALAGAGDFFIALLEKQYQIGETPNAVLQQPFLFVVGSAFETAKQRVKHWREKAISISTVQTNFELIEIDEQHFVLALQEKVENISAVELRKTMAKIVQQLVQQLSIKELFIEGGSTAASVLAVLDITSLTPINELSRGVVRMKCSNFMEGEIELFVTVKPGSYELSKQILDLYS